VLHGLLRDPRRGVRPDDRRDEQAAGRAVPWDGPAAAQLRGRAYDGLAARKLGIDPAEIRRRNFIPSDKFPYTIPSGNEYDSGNYEAALDKLLEMSHYQQLRAEQAEARAQGRCAGIGVVSTIEPGVFDWGAYSIIGARGTGVPEGATVSIDVWGKIIARVGFAAEGQGQYTLITQLLADYFSVSPEDAGRAAGHAVGAAALWAGRQPPRRRDHGRGAGRGRAGEGQAD
jgi:CO/xanthine dehydrogenase Mo-binding subunit